MKHKSEEQLYGIIRNGMGSFFSIVILSFINLILVMGDFGIVFPFSLTSSLDCSEWSAAYLEEDRAFAIAMMGIAVGIIAVFGILYWLAKRFFWPVIVGTILFGLDCIYLIYYCWDWTVVESFPKSMLIDAAFHIWAMTSLVRMWMANVRLGKLRAAGGEQEISMD